ncbi:hypothetical protein NC652_038816 [Populus alba x Populus x berolinensis]|nr:hypothetical protein NC652_038816 [Populus alba x Populus x berolinensis]
MCQNGSAFIAPLAFFLLNHWSVNSPTQSSLTGEIEENIGILEKQVPDWICRIPAPSGDVLYEWAYRTSL